jgi:hypothetical protein
MHRAAADRPRPRRAEAAWLAWLLAALVALAPVVVVAAASAQDVTDATALPVPVGPVEDAEFGVSSHHLALQRRVWMWQWQATPAGVRGGWSEHLLASPDAAHRNPTRWPLPATEWRAGEVRVAGHPVSAAAIQALGAWHVLRPSLDAVPANISATFQPEGDGLGTADDPQHPAIGDLHVAWRDWRLPPLAGRLQLRQGVWQVVPAAVYPAAEGLRRREGHGGWLAWIAGLGLLALLAWRRLRRRSRRR